MITKLVRLLFLLVCVQPFTVPAKQPSLAASVPDGAIAFVEFSNLGEIVRAVRDSRGFAWIRATDEFKKYEDSDAYRKANAFRATAELMLGSSLWDVSADLLGGRIAVALYPDPGNSQKPRGVAVLHLDESKTLDRVRDVLKPLLTASAKEVDTSALCPGATTWTIKDQAFLSMHGTWLVAAQQRDLLDRTLSILGGTKDKPAARNSPPISRPSPSSSLANSAPASSSSRWADSIPTPARPALTPPCSPNFPARWPHSSKTCAATSSPTK